MFCGLMVTIHNTQVQIITPSVTDKGEIKEQTKLTLKQEN
jgi:hypothetical protein